MDQDLIAIVNKWHIKANNDLKTIEVLLKSENVVTDSVCFHSQQAVEKYLKSYLIAVQKSFKNTHNITAILKLCNEIDNDFEKLDFAVYLTNYAVELRYSDDFYIPDLEEAKEAYEIALKVKDFVVEKIKVIELFS
ncbi:MAG: HEPN domain-containing protein [Candidatus Cloacimonadota bacterium]|nr:HEPN domain-containing protein [Candidatus Cloacimonadota bacterium]